MPVSAKQKQPNMDKIKLQIKLKIVIISHNYRYLWIMNISNIEIIGSQTKSKNLCPQATNFFISLCLLLE